MHIKRAAHGSRLGTVTKIFPSKKGRPHPDRPCVSAPAKLPRRSAINHAKVFWDALDGPAERVD